MSLPLLIDQSNKPLLWTAQSCVASNCKAAHHIMELSQSLMEACNPRQYDLLKSLGDQHVAPTFQAKFEDCHISSWEAFLTSQRYWGEKHPQWENRLVSVNAEVNENHANGMVYLLTEILRWSRDVKRTAVTVHKWKKRDGRWVCHESTTMRGLDPMLVGSGKGFGEELATEEERSGVFL